MGDRAKCVWSLDWLQISERSLGQLGRTEGSSSMAGRFCQASTTPPSHPKGLWQATDDWPLDVIGHEDCIQHSPQESKFSASGIALRTFQTSHPVLPSSCLAV